MRLGIFNKLDSDVCFSVMDDDTYEIYPSQPLEARLDCTIKLTRKDIDLLSDLIDRVKNDEFSFEGFS